MPKNQGSLAVEPVQPVSYTLEQLAAEETPQHIAQWDEYIASRKQEAADLERVDPRDYLVRYR